MLENYMVTEFLVVLNLILPVGGIVFVTAALFRFLDKKRRTKDTVKKAWIYLVVGILMLLIVAVEMLYVYRMGANV